MVCIRDGTLSEGRAGSCAWNGPRIDGSSRLRPRTATRRAATPILRMIPLPASRLVTSPARLRLPATRVDALHPHLRQQPRSTERHDFVWHPFVHRHRQNCPSDPGDDEGPGAAVRWSRHGARHHPISSTRPNRASTRAQLYARVRAPIEFRPDHSAQHLAWIDPAVVPPIPTSSAINVNDRAVRIEQSIIGVPSWPTH